MLVISIKPTDGTPMDQSRLDALHDWFDSYVRTFQDIDEDGLRNIQLKVVHTRKVCEVMELLTSGEGVAPEEARIAAAIALLHDVGRFPQYRRWRTFRDSHSDNHARLSVEVMREQGVLNDLPLAERLQIEEAVRFHNLRDVPRRLEGEAGFFLRLIRDADKLDIWRVFIDHFHQPPETRASAVSLGFPDIPEVSPSCVSALGDGRVVDLDTVRSLNDFRLLQISWAYDLNFTTSYRLLAKRDYITQLAATIHPETKVNSHLNQAVARAMTVVADRGQG